MEEEAKEELTLFIYCDGSSKPNPGPSGYGVHMVLGSNLIKPKNIIGKYKLTTDGYITNVEFKNSKNKELLGLFKCIEIYGYEDSSDTNNMGELDAVIQSINMLDTIIDSIETKPSKLVFLLDSTYVINNIEKVRTKDFDMSSINANKTKVNKLKKMFDKIENKYDITIKKVKAHTDDLGNIRADMLATMGRLLRYKKNRSNYNIYIGDKDFWKDPNVDRDFYYMKLLFNFYPDTDIADRSYYGLNYKKENEIGKKLSMVTYNIIKTIKVNDVIYGFIKLIRDALGEHYVPYILRLNDIFNKNILRDLLIYKDDFLTIENKRHFIINTVTGVEVARELYPPALSKNVIDKFIQLDEEMIECFNNKNLIDITDLLYNIVDDKYTIKKELVNDKVIINYKYDKTKLKLLMKYDLPPRNTLKRLEKQQPKVYLIVKDIGNILEYKTIVVLNNDDAILTTNYYSNKVPKK